jgi:hypothetical protein
MMQSFQTFIDRVENWRHEASNKFLKQLFSLLLIMLLLFSGTALTGCSQNPNPDQVTLLRCGTQIGIKNECSPKFNFYE